MAPSNTTSGGAATKKRSNSQQDRDDPEGKRVKTSPPGEDSGPSPTPAKRGVIRPPTDEEWAQVVATGVTEAGDDQLLGQVIDVPRSTPATSATPSAGSPAQSFPFNTRQSKSAGKAPAEAGGSRGPSTSTPRPVPGPRPDSSDFTTDEEILHKWTDLETLIEQYVQECIVDKMPKDDELIDSDYDDDDDHNRLFEAFRHLVGHKNGRDVAGEEGSADDGEGGADDSMAHAMCQNATYAPYLFQITIWKYLIDALIARGNHNWAVDLDMGTHNGWRPTRGPGAGLGISTDGLTNNAISKWIDQRHKSYEHFTNFFVFRKFTCDYLYELLLTHIDYTERCNLVCAELIDLFRRYFKPDYSCGTEAAWLELVRLTTDVISQAWDLAIMMRRSDGVWDPVMIKPGQALVEDAVMLHPQVELAAPSGQNTILATSEITLTAVPGLVKHEVVRDPSKGPDGCRLRTMRMVRAKVFVDLGLDDVRGSA